MQRRDPSPTAIILCLAALAGFVDAVAYSSMGGFFASFMSGNSTRMGVALADGMIGDAMTGASLILSFVSGVILSAVIARAWPDAHEAPVMTAVTLMLAIAAALAMIAPGPITPLLLAAAMGCENGAFSRDGRVPVGLTYMTGTLVRMGHLLADSLMGAGERWSWVSPLLTWLCFLAGGVLGAGAYNSIALEALWFGAIAAAALAAMLVRLPRKGPWEKPES